MLVYIIKSAACLALLFVCYKLFLEKENMHKFKRFYLLGALVFSMLVPALVFTEYVEVSPTAEVAYAVSPPAQLSDEVIHVAPALEADVLDIAPILWGIYFLGLFFFGLKFIRNLFRIFRRIRSNPKYKFNRFTQVLLRERITPHTFFSYIFLNKAKFESKQIPREVLLHEETHAQQKHSWDVVFVEFLQVVFWINPFIYLAKRAIKLNHEFLADQAVLQKNIDETTYKNTLLSYLSPDSEKKYQPLANAINYSSTRLTLFGKTFTLGRSAGGQVKKRFTIMKTNTSKKAVLLRSLLLLPLLAGMLYGFSETKVETIVVDPIHKTNPETELKPKGNQPSQLNLDEWKKSDKYAIWIDGDHSKNKSLENYSPSDFGNYFVSYIHDNARSERFPQPYQVSLYSKEAYEKQQERKRRTLTININKYGELLINGELVALVEADTFIAQVINEEAILKTEIVTDEHSPKGVVSNIQHLLEKFDLAQVDIVGPKEFSSASPAQKGATKKQLATYTLLAKRYNKQPKATRVIPLKDLKVLESVYLKMTDEQKTNAEPFPECAPNEDQEGATTEQIEEYNALAKKYNTMLSKNKSIRIQMQDVERLEYLNSLMSDKQKADAEPFPDFPEPPPPPKAPKAKKGGKNGIPPPPPPPEAPDGLDLNEEALLNEIENQEILAYENVNVYIHNSESSAISAYPNLQETIYSLAEQDAQFYFNGNKISTKEGLQIVKSKKNIAIETHPYTNKKPEVRIYTDDSDVSIPSPSSPPTPKSPLDHVIEMAKKGALFYFEGEEISSDKAISILKENNDINIDSRSKNGNRPIVKLSAEPITID